MTNPHIETLVNFLRDFADANADSFDPEQIENLKQSAIAIVVLDKAVDELVKERDEVRREICERISTTKWEPQFPLMTKIEYAEVRGWDCFKERNEEDDDGIGYDPHAEAWAARAEEGKKRQEEYRKRHEERIAWIARVREEEEAKKRQEGYPPF